MEGTGVKYTYQCMKAEGIVCGRDPAWEGRRLEGTLGKRTQGGMREGKRKGRKKRDKKRERGYDRKKYFWGENLNCVI